jgi:hypothetical protein
MLAATAAAAALSIVPAGVARAGSCGGGSDSGDSGSDSSSSDISDSSSSSDSTPACSDATDIVGYRRCTTFGRWGTHGTRRPLFVELGMATRTFASPLREGTGTYSHEDEQFTYRVVGMSPGAEAPRESALLSTLRIGVGLPRGFYAAVEGELGGLVRSSSQAEMTSTGNLGGPTLTPATDLALGALGVIGIRGETNRGTLGVEVAGGVRAISYRYDSHYLACETQASYTVASPILEARARAALWLSPFVNIGATAGASVIDRGAWMAGLNLGFVSQAFGGLRD